MSHGAGAAFPRGRWIVELMGAEDERVARWDRVVAEYGRGLPG